MSLYNRAGTNISSGYSKNGSALNNAYDVGGGKTFTNSYSINMVPSYYKKSVLAMCDQITNLSNDWENFIFITDPHGYENCNHSQNIALYLLNSAPISMIVLGGDYSASLWNKTEYDNYVMPFKNSSSLSKIYALCGNHETYGRPNGVFGVDPDNYYEARISIYNDFLKAKPNVQGAPEHVFYYIDDSSKKVRYLFINTSDYCITSGDPYHVSPQQINWMEEVVKLPNSSWSLLAMGHLNLNDMGGLTSENELNGDDITRTIKKCNGTIIGYICGHQHIDHSVKLNGFQNTTLLCDKNENINYYNGYSMTNRQAGTTSEQAISVISFNTKTKNVTIRRIGAGRKAFISYSYK